MCVAGGGGRGLRYYKNTGKTLEKMNLDDVAICLCHATANMN